MIVYRVDWPLQKCLDVVYSLRSQGAVQERDWTWAHYQVKYDPITGHHASDAYTLFKFTSEQWAMLFALKWM
jgi:hypothetical protein